MKKRMYLLLFLCTSLFAACQKDDIVKNNDEDERIIGGLPQPDFTGLMDDGGSIITYILYCIDSPMHIYDESVKTIDDYSKMWLSIQEKSESFELSINDLERMTAVGKMESDYYRQKTAFICSEYMPWLRSSFTLLYQEFVYTLYQDIVYTLAQCAIEQLGIF